MLVAKHFVEVLILLFICLGPLPLSFLLITIDKDRKKHLHLPHSLLIVLTSWCITQSFIGDLLGAIKQLNLRATIVSEVIVLFAGIIIITFVRPHIRLLSFQQILKWHQPLNKLEILVLGAISFVGVVIIERTMTIPITDWDSLWFHLPAMARWYQTASFSFLDEAGEIIYDHRIAFGYPHGWHVICALFLMPFQEDFLVTFPMLIAWLIMGLSVYLLSLNFRAKRIYAMTAVALILTMPFFIRIVNTMHIDLPLASFFMASLYFVFSYIQNRSNVDFLMLLASLGMVLGIKTSGVVYIFLLLAVFIIKKMYDVFVANKNYNFPISKNSKIEIILRATGIICLLFLGFFWYIKNFTELGNPLGNVQLKLANFTVFSGEVDYAEAKKYSLLHRFDLTNFSHWSFLGLQAIFRLQIPFLVILGQALFLPFAFFIRQKRIGNPTLIGLVTLLISTGFLYWNTPYSAGDPVEYLTLGPSELSPTTGDAIRYGFPFIGVLAVVAAVSATITSTPATIIVAIVLLSSLLGIVSSTLIDASQIVKFGGQGIRGAVMVDKLRHAPGVATNLILNIIKPELLQLLFYILLYTLFISITCWFLFLGINRTRIGVSISSIFRQSGRWAAIFIFILLLITGTYVARNKRDIQRYRIYGSTYEYISKKVDINERIGHLLSQRSYLFYGKNLIKKFCTPHQIPMNFFIGLMGYNKEKLVLLQLVL